MSDISRDSVISFLGERGGRVSNQQLLEHFRPLLTMAPPGEPRTASRQLFKDTVNEVASVRAEDGVKYVCLRKKYRRGAEDPTAPERESRDLGCTARDRESWDPASTARESRDPASTARDPASTATERESRDPASTAPEQESRDLASIARDRESRDPASTARDPASTAPERESRDLGCTARDRESWEPASTARENRDPASTAPEQESRDPASIARDRESRDPASTARDPASTTRDRESRDPASTAPEHGSSGEESSTPEPSDESPGYDAPPSISVTAEPGDDGGGPAARLPPDVSHLSGRTPRSSRRGGREPVSPQLRRAGLLLRAGLRDSDSSSLHSSSSVSGNEEEDGGAGSVSGSAALEPLEHAWMLSSCRARWDSLQELLLAEPGLIGRRDFITGFSCLHWAAKHGQHELLAALLTHARQHRVPVNINARASGGYTALHLAAMHGHLDVIKLLVGAYDADLDIRDYSGRKAWQYLGSDTARDVQALVGALPAAEDGGSSGAGRWRLSRVLPSQLIVHRLSEDEHRDISRKGSGRGKPRLNKIRFRTQIIHSNLTPRDPDDDDRVFKSPMRHRPKSNVFG